MYIINAICLIFVDAGAVCVLFTLVKEFYYISIKNNMITINITQFVGNSQKKMCFTATAFSIIYQRIIAVFTLCFCNTASKR